MANTKECSNSGQVSVLNEDGSCRGRVMINGKDSPCQKKECWAYQKYQKPLEREWKNTQLMTMHD